MTAYVPLAAGLSPTRWTDRHRLGEVPDVLPYGLDHLEVHGVTPRLAGPVSPRLLERVARSLRYRTGGFELLEAAFDLRSRTSYATDLVLCLDERSGVPALLVAGTSRRFAPVMTGIAWLTTPDRLSDRTGAMIRRSLSKAAAVWTHSRPMTDTLVNEWEVDKDRVHFVPMGVDADFYRVQEPPDVPGVVASAGEDPLRDHQLLIDAVEKVRAVVLHATIELATGLPVRMPDGLGSLHTGRLDGKMRDVYRRSSVVALAIHPTQTASGLTVILEAMSCGRPVVVTDNPGLDDYVEHGVTGVLVPPGNRDAFAEALTALLLDPEKAARMGAAAADRVRERFTSADMSENLARIARRIGAP